MRTMTVRGEMSPEDLGITLAHEHLLIDVSCRRRETSDPYLKSIALKPVDCSILGDLRRNPMISADSLLMKDVNLAIQELSYYKEAGGRTLVDLTNRMIGGNPVALKQISQATGIQIIAGCGYYSPVLPPNTEELSVSQLTDNIVREVRQGVDGTDVKPGIIGEIGTSWPLTAVEERILRAAARAQSATGLALSIHPSPWDNCAMTLLDIVESEGADLGRVVMCHLDHFIDLKYHKAVAKRGAYVEYDRFGVEWYRTQETLQCFPRDTERVAALIELIRSGYVRQLLISHDVCQKIELKKYGGHGYSHILRYIVPMMKRMGISEEDIRVMLVENPKRVLSF